MTNIESKVSRTNKSYQVLPVYGTSRRKDTAKMTKTTNITDVKNPQVASIPNAAYKLVMQSGQRIRAIAVPEPKRPVQVPCHN